MKYKLLLAAVALFIGTMTSYGQLLQWNTFGNTGTETTEPSVTNDVNISAATITFGAGVTPAANANRFGGSNWFDTGNTGTGNIIAEAFAGNNYVQFTVTPNSGFSFTATSFVFNWDKSGTGPKNVALRSSADGYAADLGIVAPTGTIGVSNTITISGLSNIATATTFRLYGYGATFTTGTGGFDIGSNLVNVQLNGTTASTCTPPANPVGTISGTTPACGSTNLSYAGADSANCYWQTTASGTSMGSLASATYPVSTSGNYYVRRYDGVSCWSTATAAYAVTVNTVPTVTSNPSSVSIIENNNTSFTVATSASCSYQWQVDIVGVGNFNNVTNSAIYGGATSATLTITAAPLSMNGYIYKCVVVPFAPCTGGNVSSNATLTVTPNYSFASDIVAVAASEPATISSTVNGVTIATATNGVQVWQITVRDGGATADADVYPTILTAFTIAQVGNTVTSWSDAIFSIGLFDGATFIANGTVFGTQIVFTGLNVSVADGTSKTLSLRLSLKCPLGPNAFDNEHFGFSISNSNTIFSASGSGKQAGFAAAVSLNTKNVIDVTATKLVFTTQPVTTGLDYTMTTVVVKAYDACNNFDSGFTGTVSLNSSGTMNAVTPVVAVAGVATFTGIVHTVIGTNLTLTATSSITAGISSTFNIVIPTTFNAGELLFVGYNGQTSGSNDEYLIATLVAIKPGTQFSIVNSRYEAGAAANVRTNKWGGGGDTAQDAPYTTLISYNGTTDIPAGSILTITTDNSANWFGSVDVITGTTTTTRTSEFSGSLVFGTTYNPNISTSDPDQMYLVQGSFVSDGTIDVGQANYLLSGTLLHGLTNAVAWVPLTSACSGAGTGGSTRQSRLATALTCFNVENSPLGNISGYYENDKEHGIASIRQIINAVANVASNWTLGSGGYIKDPTSSLTTRAAKTFVVGPGNASGSWVGDVSGDSTNWFNCGNWEGLKVPDSTTDVVLDAGSLSDAIIDYTAAYSDNYLDIATSNNLSITNRKVQLKASASNVLEVYGNLAISATGALDMDDANPATADGIIKLKGNWTNSVGNTAFSEGNGTVEFVGTTPQIISNVTPEGTETFYNVVLNNNFNTAVSNDLIATGNLTVAATKTLTIKPNDFVQVNKNLTNNGTLNVENNGSLVQVEDSGVNTGNINVERITQARHQDYVYWSSPVEAFAVSLLPNAYRYEWGPTSVNANGTQGNWIAPTTTDMTKGKGYIARASNGASTPQALPIMFTGKPFNGQFNFPIARGTNTSSLNDNWNLIGNPYPSAIDALAFLQQNAGMLDPVPTIEGSVRLWMHGILPNTIYTSPFYQNYTSNYSTNDYVTFNALGSSCGTCFNGYIASGQGFFVVMKDGPADTSQSVLFKNDMRSRLFNNSNFFRTTAQKVIEPTAMEKHRMWLDLIDASGTTIRTLVGYATGATLAKDNMFDAYTKITASQNFYSLIGQEVMSIQGRPVPFDNSDMVPLGLKINTTGSYTIAIGAVDGLFGNTNQNIYLEDTALNIIHDLRQAPYVFTATAGRFDTRFVLRYTNSNPLGTDDFTTLNNSVVVATPNPNQMSITSTIENMKSVAVYDILGRVVYTNTSVNASQLLISDVVLNQQALIVKITLDNGQIVTRKIVL